ncbi:ABC transporter ATP-binding protein [Bisgaard Taxon 45]
MAEMVIELDCGASVQILKKENGKYQLFEVIGYEVGGECVYSVVARGEQHQEINHVFGDLMYFALNEYETLTVQEMKDVVLNTMNKIDEWFKLHSEYLATL